MTYQHTNRFGKVYHLLHKLTKKGNKTYYFAKKASDKACDAMPDGFEVYEQPNGQVYCRRERPKLIADVELAIVRQALEACDKASFTYVEAKDESIIVHEGQRIGPEAFAIFGAPFRDILISGSYQAVLKFDLIDEESRTFSAWRWCFRGSVDDWIPLRRCGELGELAEKLCPHVGEESMFETF